MASLPPIAVDLRSDTVTHPTPEMRDAMAAAPVGDDVFGDDPTVIALEERAAALLGKEAALFVASGTMGNLVSLMSQVPRGGEVIAPAEGHVVNDEAVNYAVVAGAGIRPIAEDGSGRMPLELVADSLHDDSDPHAAQTALVIVENCHAHTMSRPITPEYMRQLREAVGSVPLHVDGARLFNAAVALGVSAAELVADADTATFCLSKGLAAPVGSVVVGSADAIHRARRARKLLGGGMRQAGVLAAAGLLALSDADRPTQGGTVRRLAEDHVRARRLAQGLAAQHGIVSPGHLAQPGEPGALDPARVTTNFVLFRIEGSPQRRTAYLTALRDHGVAMVAYPHDQVRAVTHIGIDDEDLDRALDASARALAATA